MREDRNRYKSYCGSTSISFWVTTSYRIGQYIYSKRSNLFFKIFFKLFQIYYYFVKLSTGIQLPIEVQSGGGLLFPHYSYVVFAGAARLGKNCTIHQGCTIGMTHFGNKIGAPILGNNVVMFPNSNVTGRIKIGNNVIIGANSVVTHDIPDNCIAVGSPARIISNDTYKVLGNNGRAIYWAMTEKSNNYE